MADLDQFLTSNRQRFEDEWCELLRIPSVSTDSRHKDDVRRAAEWMAKQFEQMRMATEVITTSGHPIVYAESPQVPGRPVVLVYGHYDVQPPDPLNEWTSPPFEPTRREGNLVARGATDDKGQMLTHVMSAKAWIESQGTLPVQLKFLIEGEEEVGSEALYKYLDSSDAAKKLACDIVVISDSSQYARGKPAITYGLRGIAYFELFLQGPKQDLHSGVFGGAVVNPAIALAKMLSSLIDSQGRITIPGFYDGVDTLSDEERAQLAALQYNEDDLKRQLDVTALGGEAGFSALERRWVRPTFDVNGLTSGYQGEGAKTVLPARASAKFSFRLVPHQDPALIAANLRKMLTELCPAGIRMDLREMHHAPGLVIPRESPYVHAASRAIARGFGQAPVMIREGGSIPIVNHFADRLGVDTLLLGWGLDDDNTHSPNEKFSIDDFHRGIRSSAYLWEELGKQKVERTA